MTEATAEFRSSELLTRHGFRHAFFTRRGGVSKGPFDSLSFIWNSGDEPERVVENIRRASVALGVAPERVLFLSQVHGTNVVSVDEKVTRDETLGTSGDAVISADVTVACAVRCADCTPILLADPRSGAVCAVHSGWRGTVGRIALSAVAAMEQRHGARPSELLAAVGPHIELKSFEVGDDVATELAAASTEGERVIERGTGRPHVNLRRVVVAQLREAGVLTDHIDHVYGDTVSEADAFFSYRRDGKVGGRLLNAICARGE